MSLLEHFHNFFDLFRGMGPLQSLLIDSVAVKDFLLDLILDSEILSSAGVKHGKSLLLDKISDFL